MYLSPVSAGSPGDRGVLTAWLMPSLCLQCIRLGFCSNAHVSGKGWNFKLVLDMCTLLGMRSLGADGVRRIG